MSMKSCSLPVITNIILSAIGLLNVTLNLLDVNESPVWIVSEIRLY